jgi:hypothetical protein
VLTYQLLSAQEELEKFYSRSTARYTLLINRLIRWHLQMGTITQKLEILEQLGDLLASTMGMADMYGARRTLLDVQARKRKYGMVQYAAPYDQTPDTPSPVVPHVPFDEAIRDMISRAPAVVKAPLGRRWLEVSKLYTKGHGFALAKSNDIVITRRVQDYISQSLKQGETVDTGAQAIADLGNWSQSYGETVYRTNLSTGYAEGSREIAKDKDLEDFVVGLKREPVGDADTRPNHNFTLIAALDDPIWRDLSVPGGYNCFPAGVVVEGTFDAAFKVPYEGDLIKITTVSGRVLTVTPNHPILTAGGFVLAKHLNKGIKAVCQVRELNGVSVGCIYDNQPPAAISDVFEMFAARFPVGRLRGTVHNFYGDAEFFNGDIQVVNPKGILEEGVVSDSNKSLPNFPLPVSLSPSVDVASSGAFDLGFDRLNASGHSLPCGSALAIDDSSVVTSPLKLIPFEPLRFGGAANVNASRYKSLRDGISTDSKPIGDRFEGFPSSVAFADSVNIKTDQFRPYTDAAVCKREPNGFVADAALVSQLLQGFPRLVSFDEIVKISKVHGFSGHVYDLQSPYGWIVANGIYTSNCRCSMRPYDKYEAARDGKLVNGKLPPARHPAGMYNDPGFTGKVFQV